MPLLIRRSEKEACLRSVGDAPNGIVGVTACEEWACFTIDGGFEPPSAGGTVVVAQGDAMPDELTKIGVDELLTACENVEVIQRLVNILVQSIANAIPHRTQTLEFQALHRMIELLEETTKAGAVEIAGREREG